LAFGGWGLGGRGGGWGGGWGVGVFFFGVWFVENALSFCFGWDGLFAPADSTARDAEKTNTTLLLGNKG